MIKKPERPQTPVHDQIEKDGNKDKILLLIDFIEVVLNDHSLIRKTEYETGPMDYVTTQREKAQLAFDYFGYNYRAYLREKDELMQYIKNGGV